MTNGNEFDYLPSEGVDVGERMTEAQATAAVTPRPGGSRADHLAWCKVRAQEYVRRGDLTRAWASMCSDLNKHDQTRGHSACELGMMLMVSGHLSTAEEMGKFIDGFN